MAVRALSNELGTADHEAPRDQGRAWGRPVDLLEALLDGPKANTVIADGLEATVRGERVQVLHAKAPPAPIDICERAPLQLLDGRWRRPRSPRACTRVVGSAMAKIGLLGPSRDGEPVQLAVLGF